LHQCGRCSSQPERHLHGAVQVSSGGQFGTGLLRPADLGLEGAEAMVAMGQERAHAQRLGQREGFAVAAFGPLGIRGTVLRGDLSEESEGSRLTARARPARSLASSLRPASK
jgi:hypothetical protein